MQVPKSHNHGKAFPCCSNKSPCSNTLLYVCIRFLGHCLSLRLFLIYHRFRVTTGRQSVHGVKLWGSFECTFQLALRCSSIASQGVYDEDGNITD